MATDSSDNRDVRSDDHHHAETPEQSDLSSVGVGRGPGRDGVDGKGCGSFAACSARRRLASYLKSPAHVGYLVKEANRLGLAGAGLLSDLELPFLCDAYNGIGPEWAPDELVARYTLRYFELEPATLIHDVNYELLRVYGDSTARADRRYYRNCVKTAKALYRRGDPRRDKLLAKAKFHRWLLKTFTRFFKWRENAKRVICILPVMSVLLYAGCKSQPVQDVPEPQFPQIERWWK